MKKVVASILIAFFAFAACNGEDLPPADQGDKEQTETPGGEDSGGNPEEEPGDGTGTTEPEGPFVWPEDPTAFDYGLDNGNSRRAEYLTKEDLESGIDSQLVFASNLLQNGI